MKRYIAKIGLAVVLVSLTACNDWLDVSPKTEIKAKDNFSSEQGFKDALTGCYLTMTSSSLYGKELTFGYQDLSLVQTAKLAAGRTKTGAGAFSA